jgi:hypothetical protein
MTAFAWGREREAGWTGEGAGLGRLGQLGHKGSGGPLSNKNYFLFYFQIRILLNIPNSIFEVEKDIFKT